MKVRLFTMLVILAIAVAGIATPAVAQAYNTSFTTSITYQNVDTAATTLLQIHFYASSTTTTPITIDRPSLAAGAGTSVYLGSLTEISGGFRGSAVMTSDRLLVATLVQVPQSEVVKNRPLSNGFFAGTPEVLIATVLKNTFNTNSVFSVQNTDSELNNVVIKFYNTSAVKVHEMPVALQPGASTQVDAGTITALGASFNGSVVVSATRADDTDGNIVATSLELSTTSTGALAFEGVPGGATGGADKIYMASALCNAFGGQNSAYAVQNTSLTDATSVTVLYSNGRTETKSIGPGAKQSFVACQASGMPDGFSGSATITSTATNVVAIGKVYGLGLSTGFLGAFSGDPTLALPYVRWSETQYATGVRQRAYIAIQNVGDAAIPADALSVVYKDKNGVTVFTHTFTESIAVGAKVNSNPYITSNPATAEFGYYTDGSFGGGAVVECSAADCAVVAVVRIQSRVPAFSQTVAEDYNGIPVP
jgi:hypothetical protein